MLVGVIQYYPVLASEIQLFSVSSVWQPMQVALGSQIYNFCKWRHLMAEFTIDASGANWWTTLKQMQVVPPDGQIYN